MNKDNLNVTPNSSAMSLDDWRGTLTTFEGFYKTRPASELDNASWEDVAAVIAPAVPAILDDKTQGKYVVPCLLQEAPLIGKTLDAARAEGQPTIGKQRSASHVTQASWLMMDCDGLEASEFKKAVNTMAQDGITVLAYTSYSHGSPNKPGVRARLAIPLDRPVSAEEYRLAWHGLDALYFGGIAGNSDASGAKLCQQQGCWCCHPDRVAKANKVDVRKGVASADTLIAAASKVAMPDSPDANNFPPSDPNEIAEVCQQIKVFRDNKGAGQTEPLWYACLGVVGFCTDGEAICHEWSSGHPEYDPQETAQKIAQRIEAAGPTTCAHFQSINPDGCMGCTQVCKSPIVLGVEDEVLQALPAMQKKFGLLRISGKVMMFDRIALNKRSEFGSAQKLELINRPDGRLLIEREAGAYFPGVDVKKLAHDFLVDPQTICHEGLEFNPAGTTENYLNLWVAHTINPKFGRWQLIHSFLYEVICDGNDEHYAYLTHYLAHALQRPEEKPGVMIILMGGQGTGKGTFAKILCKIWSATYLQIHQVKAITGDFNESLERSYIVWLDEALFAGDRSASDALKSLVTEPVININPKNQPHRQLRSYHRFFAATNAEHFKATERDDRRDFVLRVSEKHKGDDQYWQRLNQEIDGDGVAAMAYELMAMDVSSFNIRSKPDTNELVEQKIQSLGPIPRWWHNCLYRGEIYPGQGWANFVPTGDAIAQVVEVAGRVYKKPNDVELVQTLKKLCPSAVKGQVAKGSLRQRGFHLPPLAQARAEFESYIGGVVKW